jgi:excinuclease ABC subunit C
VILPRTSEALYLLQRVRDEAHRFAITYHRQKRSSTMLVSLLDDVPGLGETRRKALMKQFGSLKRLRAATVEELTAVPGIGRRTAEAVLVAVAGPPPAGGVEDVGDGVPGPGPELDGGSGVAVLGAGAPGAGDIAEIGRVQSPAGTGA